jgi:hypothetical protein
MYVREEFDVTGQSAFCFARAFGNDPSLTLWGSNEQETVGFGNIITAKNDSFAAINALSHGIDRWCAPSVFAGDAPYAGIGVRFSAILNWVDRFVLPFQGLIVYLHVVL